MNLGDIVQYGFLVMVILVFLITSYNLWKGN